MVTTGGNVPVGVGAVVIEVTLSGFASIYFEKVIKTDPLTLNIWERNFQLALVRHAVAWTYVLSLGLIMWLSPPKCDF